MLTLKFTTRVLILLTAALPLGALADDLATSSCALLTEAAKVRAENQLTEILKNTTVTKAHHDYDDYVGAGALPDMVNKAAKAIPLRVLKLSQDAAALRAQAAPIEQKMADLDKELTTLQDAERALKKGAWHNPKTKKRMDELKAAIDETKKELAPVAELEKADRDQIAKDLWPALQPLQTFASGSPMADGFATDYSKFNTRIYSVNFEVPDTSNKVYFSGVINLKTGLVTYEAGMIGQEQPKGLIANFGTTVPSKLASDKMAKAVIKDGLRKLQLDLLPEVCKAAAKQRFEAIAEADGVKAFLAQNERLTELGFTPAISAAK